MRDACHSRGVSPIGETGYLPMVPIHGAMSMLRASKVAENAGREACGLRTLKTAAIMKNQISITRCDEI